MYWLRFSKFVQYVTTFVMHVISVTLTFNIFFSPQSTAYAYEDLSSIAVYHRNSSNRYWFVFSSLISMLLLGLSIAYYTISYANIIWKTKTTSNRWLLSTLLFSEEVYKMTLIDFGFVSISIAWNIIWAIHLLVEIIQCSLEPKNMQSGIVFEEASLLLLLSTQITLIALRYPSLFLQIENTAIYGMVEQTDNQIITDDIIAKITS